MGTSNYIITTRPEGKFKPMDTRCISIKNVPLTKIVRNGPQEEIIQDMIQNRPGIIVITSSVGASEFFKYYYKYTDSPHIIAIGDKTADEIKKYTGDVSVPAARNSYGVITMLENYLNFRIALFRSNESNNIINDWLKQRNANFTEYHIYNVVKLENNGIKELFMDKDCRGILLTSSMEAEIFHEVLGDAKITKNIYAIGKVTEKTLQKYGYDVSFTGNSDFDSTIKYIDNENC
ncbi:MAG: uroporphyrinogen-III synthase [Ferroplasma sp.]|uniref:uroporphyrinogen-III synthase n=1 Tax=Ferroplasma sp. TaxID=2591003 RepID=UPI00281508DA|nr:uroporphyrinogen-III synthase [Ferroplasma sp.]WMT51335.1 MAG: uroporphyrinogen-III synthase [Ferroplasma sp.]